MRKLAIRGLGVAAVASVLPAVIMPAIAQDGGLSLTFGLNQRFELTENQALAPVSAGTTAQSATQLSFGMTTETALSSLALTGSGTLRAVKSPGAASDVGFDNTQLALRYTRTGADALFKLNGSVKANDIAFLRPLEDFIDPDTGLIDLPEDLDDLNGTGTRRSTALNASLSYGIDAPWGVDLTAGFSKLDYVNATSAALVGSLRTSLGATLRFEVNPAATATLGLTQSRFDSEAPGSPARTTLGFEAAITAARPDGSLNARFTADDRPDGARIGLSFGRDYELPDGSLSFNLGVTRSGSGDTTLNGSIAWQKELPDGRLSAQLRRAIASGADDTDRLNTTLSLAYSRDLSAVSGISLDMTYADSKIAGAGTSTTNGSIGATYTHALTEDWGLDLGYRHRWRDTTTSADSDSVFLVLKRSFAGKP